jgi:hypothetical protein
MLPRPSIDALPNPLPCPGSPARLRPLAARLLEGPLVRLVRARATIDRRLGRALDVLHTGQLYRQLGYVRTADYLTERLGMSLRSSQSLLRIERAFRDLPSIATAFDSGSLGVSKARVVAAIATPDTQDLWLTRAGMLTVRQLEEQARADRAAAADAKGRAGSGFEQGEAGLLDPGAATPADAASGATGSSDEAFVPVSFTAPGQAVAMWHWVLDLVRRVAGRQEPAWRCAEFLAAEYLSGAPSQPSCSETASEPADSALLAANDRPSGSSEGLVSRHADEPHDSDARQRIADLSGMEAWTAATQAVREALSPLGAAADPDAILSGRLPEFPGISGGGFPNKRSPGASGERVDPWDLDTHLRVLVRLRQSLAWRQGRLLRTLAAFALHRELGFGSLGEFSTEVLGASPRRTRYLVSLDRRLDPLQQLRDAYRRGLVTWCQARLLIRVVRPGTESRWIRYARKVTVRRLEDVVTSCEIETALAEPKAESSGGGSGSDRPGRKGFGPLPPVEPEPGGSEWHTSALRPVNPPLPLTFETGTDPDSARHRITFYAPADVARLWRSAIAVCRASAGTHLREWECLLIFIQEMRETWENPGDPDWRRRYRILERDGWRCKVPGCTSRAHLNAHHILFRSHQGDDDEGNLVTLCVGHHQAGLHQGRIGCSGRAPDALWWELGRRQGAPPLARYFGERIAGAGERPAGRHEAPPDL